MVPSAVNIYFVTTDNSYLPTDSSRFVLDLYLETNNIRMNSFRSSLSATTLSLVLTVIRFHVIFYVWSFLVSLVSHTLTFSERFLLVTNSSKSCYAMVLSTPRSLLAFSGSTAFVTKLNRSQLSSANAFVKLSMVVVRDSMLFSCQFTTAAEKAWWCVWAGDEMPAIPQASPASLASSGEINKNLERA